MKLGISETGPVYEPGESRLLRQGLVKLGPFETGPGDGPGESSIFLNTAW